MYYCDRLPESRAFSVTTGIALISDFYYKEKPVEISETYYVTFLNKYLLRACYELKLRDPLVVFGSADLIHLSAVK